MKPRIAVVFVLSLGLLMSGSGATLAVISDSGSASEVQYPDLTEPKGDEAVGDVLGQEQSAGGDEGEEEESVPVQEERQVASSGGGDLPFTGFLAIPLLIVGVMLLVAGGVMRTRTRPGPDS